MAINRFYKQILFFAVLVCCCSSTLAQTLAALKYDLEKATSPRAKADACFNISKKYADGLKIDSALYFAEKIKEFSQKDNYETGSGKYHLALSIAFYFRGRTDESIKRASEAIRIFRDQKEYTFLGIAYWQLATDEHVLGN